MKFFPPERPAADENCVRSTQTVAAVPIESAKLAEHLRWIDTSTTAKQTQTQSRGNRRSGRNRNTNSATQRVNLAPNTFEIRHRFGLFCVRCAPTSKVELHNYSGSPAIPISSCKRLSARAEGRAAADQKNISNSRIINSSHYFCSARN